MLMQAGRQGGQACQVLRISERYRYVLTEENLREVVIAVLMRITYLVR